MVNMVAAQAGSPVPIIDELQESQQQDRHKTGKESGDAGENDNTEFAVCFRLAPMVFSG
jgi:hypothetical protein